MFLAGGLWVFPEILTRSKCFYGEAKFPGENKKAKINFHTSVEYEEG